MIFYCNGQPEVPWKSIVKKNTKQNRQKRPKTIKHKFRVKEENVLQLFLQNLKTIQMASRSDNQWFQPFTFLQMWYKETRDQINLCDQGCLALFGPRWQHLPKTPVCSQSFYRASIQLEPLPHCQSFLIRATCSATHNAIDNLHLEFTIVRFLYCSDHLTSNISLFIYTLYQHCSDAEGCAEPKQLRYIVIYWAELSLQPDWLEMPFKLIETKRWLACFYSIKAAVLALGETSGVSANSLPLVSPMWIGQLLLQSCHSQLFRFMRRSHLVASYMWSHNFSEGGSTPSCMFLLCKII